MLLILLMIRHDDLYYDMSEQTDLMIHDGEASEPSGARFIAVRRVSISADEKGRIKRLPGFRSGNTVMKEKSAYTDSWVKRIAADLLKDDIDQLHDRLREHMDYKLKDLKHTEFGEGVCSLAGEGFQYTVSVVQSDEDPASYVITRMLHRFDADGVLTRKAFNDVFDGMFDRFTISTDADFDIRQIIEHVEDLSDEQDVSVDYKPSDLSSCTIHSSTCHGRILIADGEIQMQWNARTNPGALLASYLETGDMFEDVWPSLYE
jgi:hypothetical protein